MADAGGVDTSIYEALKPPQPINLLGIMNAAGQASQAMNNAKLLNMQIGARMGLADIMRRNTDQDGHVNYEKVLGAVYQDPRTAPFGQELTKQLFENRLIDAQSYSAQLDQHWKQYTNASQILSKVVSMDDPLQKDGLVALADGYGSGLYSLQEYMQQVSQLPRDTIGPDGKPHNPQLKLMAKQMLAQSENGRANLGAQIGDLQAVATGSGTQFLRASPVTGQAQPVEGPAAYVPGQQLETIQVPGTLEPKVVPRNQIQGFGQSPIAGGGGAPSDTIPGGPSQPAPTVQQLPGEGGQAGGQPAGGGAAPQQQAPQTQPPKVSNIVGQPPEVVAWTQGEGPAGKRAQELLANNDDFQDALMRIQSMQQAMKYFKTGKFEEYRVLAARVAESLGMDPQLVSALANAKVITDPKTGKQELAPDALAAAQVFAKQAPVNAMATLHATQGGSSGRDTDAIRGLFLNSQPGIEMNETAINHMFAFVKRLADLNQRELNYYNALFDYGSKNGWTTETLPHNWRSLFVDYLKRNKQLDFDQTIGEWESQTSKDLGGQ